MFIECSSAVFTVNYKNIKKKTRLKGGKNVLVITGVDPSRGAAKLQLSPSPNKKKEKKKRFCVHNIKRFT